MAIECKIGIKDYQENEKDRVRLRIYPIDDYSAWSLQLPRVAQLSTEHHFLRVPLLGQQVCYEALSIDEEDVNCGRTSASMMYNWFVLLQGGDPKSAYISHSRHGNASWPFEIRLPNGYLAFRRKTREDISGYTAIHSSDTHDPEGAPGNPPYVGPLPAPLDKCFPGASDPKFLDRMGVQGILGYGPPEYMLEMKSSDEPAMEARRQQAETIANDEALLAKTLRSLLDSLRKNNPVLFRGSVTRSAFHFTCFTGYCYLRDIDKPEVPHLWILVASPSTTRDEVKKALNWDDLTNKFQDWKGPKSSTSFIELIRGAWNDGQASLNLFRASTFFRPKPELPHGGHLPKHGLWMDYWTGNPDRAGGRYLVRSKMTEVPDEVVLSSIRGTKYPCPLDGPTGTANLWRHYLNTERTDNGVGGLYVLGLRRNLHGGVHLFPEGEKGADTKVRALAPGFVVAARLPAADSEIMQGPVKHHLASWPGFVLLRHELHELEDPMSGQDQKGGAKQDAKPERVGGFYSLYMHLASPSTLGRASGKAHAALDGADRYVSEIPWFKSLFERRFGAFVKVLEDPPGTTGAKDAPPCLPLGSLVWAAEEVELDGNGSPIKPKYQVVGELQSIEVKTKDGALRWLFKPAPARLVQAADALADGKVVSFSEPFLPVRAGEFVGWIRAAPEAKQPKKVGLTKEGESGEALHELLDIPSGFLHWQVFAPVDGLGGDVKNGIQLVLDLVKEVDEKKRDPSLPKPEAPKDVEIADDGDDNFLDLAELEGKLKSGLSQEDGEKFAKAFEELDKKSLAEFGYASDVIGIIDAKTSFAPHAEKPIWEAGCKYGYPITLQLAPEFLPAPDEHDQAKVQGAYTFDVQFKKLVGTQMVPLQCGKGCNQADCGKPGSSKGSGASHSPECKPPTLKIDAAAFKAAKSSAGSGNSGDNKPAKNAQGDAAHVESLLAFVLRVPAEADQMTLVPGEGLVAVAGEAPQGADLMLLSSATRERWRGTKLRQLSEWSVKGFDALAKKVENVIPIPKEAREVAWLDPEKEVPIARQKLSVSDGGLPASPEEWKGLFDPGQGALKFDGKIDNLHPVTAAWALNILDRYGKATLKADWTAQTFRDEDPAPLIARWLPPASGVRLGDAVQTIVIDDDFGYDQSNRVRLLAEKGETKLELATCGYGAGGVITHLAQNVCFWGDGWKLTTDPAEKGGPELVGKKTLDVPRLEFAELSGEDIDAPWNQPHALANGVLRWCVKVKDTPPSFIEGVVSVLVRKAGEPEWPTAAEPILLPARAMASGSPDEKTAAPLDRSLLRFEDGFLVGLQTASDGGDKVELFKGLTWGRCKTACTHLRLACSLLNAVQTLRSKLQKNQWVTVTELSDDGLGLQLRPTSPASFKAAALYKAATKIPGIHVEGVPDDQEKTIREVKISVDEGSLQPASAYPKLAKHRAAYELDSTGKFILGSTGAQLSDSFTVRDFAPTQQNDGVRVSEALLHVLHRIFTNAPKLTLAHVSSDGYGCWLEGPVKVLHLAEGLAKQDPRVLSADVSRLLKIVVLADADHMLPIHVDPAPLVAHLAKRSDLPPGTHLEYRLQFETLNGIHLLAPSCPFHGGPVDRATFDDLAKKSPEHLVYGPSGKAGEFCTMGFGEPKLSWVNRAGIQYLDIEFPLLGAEKAWNGYTVQFNTRPPGGSYAPQPKQQKKIAKDTRCRFSIAVRAKDPGFQGQGQKHKFRVEAVPPKGVANVPAPMEKDYDFTPRWIDGQLEVTPSEDKKTLVLKRQAAGVEIPTFVNHQAVPLGGTARVFELVVTGAGEKRVVHGITYKVRAKLGAYLDETGTFHATILTKYLPDENGPYDIKVRPLKGTQIRGVDLDAPPPNPGETDKGVST